MGYLQLAAMAGMGSNGSGFETNPLVPVLIALALCAFGAALSLLLRRGPQHRKSHHQARHAERRAAPVNPR